MSKIRLIILIIAAIAGGAPIFHPRTQPVSFEEKEKEKVNDTQIKLPVAD